MRVSARLNVNIALIAVPNDAPPSPGLLRYNRDNKKHVQCQALWDFRLLRRANGGKLPRGAIMAMVEKYRKRGTDFVTVDNLRYRLKREKIGKKTIDEISADDRPADAVKKSARQTVDSPLTEEDYTVVLGTPTAAINDDLVLTSNESVDDDEDLEEIQDKTISENTSKKSVGCPLGSFIQSKKDKEELIARCITEAAVALDEAQQCCYESGHKRLRNGSLTKIISTIEDKNQLEKGTIKRETVVWRVMHGNLDGLHSLRISPLFFIKHVIVEYCVMLAKNGICLDKRRSYATDKRPN
jgi:hypothetical protein